MCHVTELTSLEYDSVVAADADAELNELDTNERQSDVTETELVVKTVRLNKSQREPGQ